MAGYGSMLRYKWVLVVFLALLLAMLPLFVQGKPASGAALSRMVSRNRLSLKG